MPDTAIQKRAESMTRQATSAGNCEAHRLARRLRVEAVEVANDHAHPDWDPPGDIRFALITMLDETIAELRVIRESIR
jgi:hypothetical protein